MRFEDLYVQQLETLLAKQHPGERFQVINAGIAGYNTRQELIRLLAQGFDLSPDLITVGFYWNDLVANEEPLPDLATTPMRRSRCAGKGYRPASRATDRAPRPPARERAAVSDRDPDQDAAAVPRIRRRTTTRACSAPCCRAMQAFLEPYWRSTGQRLLEIAAAAREHGVPVVLLAFPMENHVKHDYPHLVWGERLREIWAPTGMPFIDVEPAYRAALKAGQNPFLPYDLHPSALGMQIAAEQLLEVITSRDLLALRKPVAGRPVSNADVQPREAVARP